MDKKTILLGIQAISLVDKEIETACKALGPPAPRINPQAFEAFLSAIVSQQLSTKVATLEKYRRAISVAILYQRN